MVLPPTNKEIERFSDSLDVNLDATMKPDFDSEPLTGKPAQAGESIVIAVDARPLQHPNSGIGKYTQKIVEYLAARPNVELKLYGSTPLYTGNVPALSKAIEVLFSWFFFGLRARRDGAHLYWGPRHQLPWFLGNIPGVLTVHDVVWKVLPKTMPRFNYLVEWLQMPFSVRRASIVVAPSQGTATEVKQHFRFSSEKIRVVFLGGDIPSDHSTSGEDTHEANRPLLFVGGDHPRKNLPMVLKALANTRNRELKLSVLGALQNPAATQALIERLNLTERVTLLGELIEEEVAHRYSSCLALVMPSLHEGFGLPVLEAARFGRPALVAAGNPMATMARGCVVVEQGNTEQLAVAMDNLVSDKQLRLQLGDEARAWAQPLTWARCSEEHLALFLRLCMIRLG